MKIMKALGIIQNEAKDCQFPSNFNSHFAISNINKNIGMG